jgi:hypothetical protein
MRCGVRVGVLLCVALVLAAPARAADKAAIDRAVAAAVSYLKSTQDADGTWKHSRIGATALCGVALLEADVPPTDPAIQKAAKAVRAASIDCTYTYSLSLMIMFLDRLGDPADAELIESMAVRLLAGQDGTGGWSYDCPSLSPAEVQRLQAQLRQRPVLVAQPNPPEAVRGRKPFSNLTPEVQQQVGQAMAGGGANAGGNIAGGGDNSNTQFAILALWIARRQGIPVDLPVKRLDARFRTSQNLDGGWGYSPRPPNMPAQALAAMPTMMGGAGSTQAMTCAGLLGLAISYGTTIETTLRSGGVPGGSPLPAPRRPAIDISKDMTVQKAIAALGISLKQTFEGQPAQEQRPGANPGAPGATQFQGNTGNRAYYTLFSLERMAMAFGLEKIGGVDWYEHGSNLLLRTQGRDGSWSGEYADAGSDTCFAILFLRRANLVQDLSATLKGMTQDVRLKAGGVGGEALMAKNLGFKGGFGSKEDSGGSKPGGPAPGEKRPTPPVIGSAPPAASNAAEPSPSPTPAPRVEPDVARLGDELVNAPVGSQEETLTKLRDSKGSEYTDALAYAIHKLSGPVKVKARDALADRLTRMKVDTLTDKLKDDDLEVRRAAALAVAMKEDRTHIPRLIELLEDPEPPVAHAAHAALKALSSQDFGPAPEASRSDVGRAVSAWKEWWSKDGGK